MFDLSQDIYSMTDFKRSTGRLVEQLRQSGRPMVLTVNGRAEVVVQEAASYQRLVDYVTQLEFAAGVRRQFPLNASRAKA
jgi:prevent-host-death family protein